MSDWRTGPSSEVFTDRVHELSILAQAAADLERGRPHHIALFGLRRIGKTLLCQEQMRHLAEQGRVVPVYMNLEGICTSPELFVQRYIGLTCFWAVAGGQGAADPYLRAVDLLQTPAAAMPVVLEAVRFLLTELGREAVDPGALLHLAFDFPDRLAAALERPIMCFLDEFTELSALARFPQVGNPYKLFRSVMQQHAHVGYVVTGSAVTAMEQMVRSHESPLFLQLRAIELPPLTAEDTQVLTLKLMGGPLSPAAQAEVYAYTAGHPFYVTALVERLREVAPGDPDAVGPDQVAHAFLLETLGARGQIYNYCRYLYDISLQKARGYAVLKALLQILAEEDGLSLTQAARRLHRRPSSVQDYLRWLIEVDLLVVREQRYFYRDEVLRYWVAYTARGIEIDGFPRAEDLKDLVADLAERFARASTQLGRAKESEVRELLRKLAGLTVPGAYLGQAAPILVPAFTRIESYRSPDGQTEIDALAENGERWAVEVKWRQKRVGRSELDQLLTAAAVGLQARPWCISQAGFTPEALIFAAENDILISSAEDLAALSKLAR
jgi:AAA+ ATPase superfamily predicted ATPase